MLMLPIPSGPLPWTNSRVPCSLQRARLRIVCRPGELKTCKEDKASLLRSVAFNLGEDGLVDFNANPEAVQPDQNVHKFPGF